MEILGRYTKYLLNLYATEKEAARELLRLKGPYLSFPQPNKELKEKLDHMTEQLEELKEDLGNNLKEVQELHKRRESHPLIILQDWKRFLASLRNQFQTRVGWSKEDAHLNAE